MFENYSYNECAFDSHFNVEKKLLVRFKLDEKKYLNQSLVPFFVRAFMKQVFFFCKFHSS